MQLKKFSIINFGIIKEEHIDFGKINLFIGNPGEGKSTILEALCYLLTNDLKDTIKEYVRRGEREFSLGLTFSHLGDEYEYYVKGNLASKASKKLVINNEEDILYNSEATERIAELIDPKLTLYSNISMQHKATELLTETPIPRLNKLKQILKVDQLKKAIIKINEDRFEVKSKVDKLKIEIDLYKNKNFYYEDLPILPDLDIESLKEEFIELIEIKSRHAKEQLEYEKYKLKLEQYERAQKELSKLDDDYKSKFDSLNNIKNNLIEVPDFDADKLEKLYNNKLQYDYSQKEFKSINERLDRKINEYENSELPKRLIQPTYLDDNIKKSKEEDLKNLELKYLKLKIEYEAVKEGKCPTCGNVYSTDDLKKLESKYNTRKKIFEEEKRSHEKLLKQLDDFKTQLNRNNQLRKQREAIKLEIDQITKEKDRHRIIDFDNEEYNRLSEIKVKFISATNHNKSINDLIDNLKKDLSIIDFKISEFKSVEKPEEFIFSTNFDKDKYLELEQQIKEYEDKEAEYKRIELFNKKIREEENATNNKVVKKEDEIIKLNKKDRLLKEAEKVLSKDFSSYLIEQGTNYLQNEMNNFFLKSYGKYSVKFTQNKNGVEYFYSEDGNDYYSVSRLSGFEKHVFAVAQRVAMCSLQDLRVFIVDEIDSDTGYEHSLKLFEAIIEEQFEQYFIITHCEEVKEYLENQPGCKVFSMSNGVIQ